MYIVYIKHPYIYIYIYIKDADTQFKNYKCTMYIIIYIYCYTRFLNCYYYYAMNLTTLSNSDLSFSVGLVLCIYNASDSFRC